MTQPLYGQEVFNYGTTVGPYVVATRGLDSIVPGQVEMGIGVGALFYRRSAMQPSLRLSFLPIEANIGISSNTEFSLRWDVRRRVEEGHSPTVGPGDLVVSTKFRLLGERDSRPAIGLVILTKLPNASDKGSWLGTDNTDFFSAVIFVKGPWIANLGLAILGSPADPPFDSSNDDFLLFGLAWRSKIARKWAAEWQVTGFVSDRRREDYAIATGTAWFRLGKGEMGIQLRKGLTRDAEDFGITTQYRVTIRKPQSRQAME